MSWNKRAITAVMRKDLKMVMQNRMVWLPMILVPAIMQVFLPLVMTLLPTFVSPEEFNIEDIRSLMGAMPASLTTSLESRGSMEESSTQYGSPV